jgi:hypothetical protein
MKPTITFLTVLFTAALINIQAQDQIVKRDGESIFCKVSEVGTEEVWYSLAEYDFDVQFSIYKSLVDRIHFANGKELVIDHAAAAMASTEANSADLFLIQNKNAIKFQFLSPMGGTTKLSYERALRPGQTFETTIGLIGLGMNNPDGAAGLGIIAGYKFIRSPDYYLKGMRYAHILKGGYVKPEIAFANYSVREDNRNVTKGAIILNIGKQWIFSDVFLVDLFGGIGYGFSNDQTGEDWPYFIAVGTDEVPLAFNWGFRIGILF